LHGTAFSGVCGFSEIVGYSRSQGNYQALPPHHMYGFSSRPAVHGAAALLASVTDAEYPQAVGTRRKIQSIAYLLLERFDDVLIEFQRPAAFGAYQVIVMLVADDVFVHLLRITQFHSPHESALDEEIERPVYGGPRDILSAPLENIHHFFSIEMAMRFEHRVEDRVSLRGEFQFVFGKIVLEQCVFCAHKLSRY
jgi:hypothetical protein